MYVLWTFKICQSFFFSLSLSLSSSSLYIYIYICIYTGLYMYMTFGLYPSVCVNPQGARCWVGFQPAPKEAK